MPHANSHDDGALEARDVSKYFGDLVALKEIWLRISPGDSVFLYGPNGAGKTTLLRTLASLARPSEGEILFGGSSLLQAPAAARAAVGFVSHATMLYGELTARENLRFTGRLFGLGELEKRIDAALDLFALRGRDRELVRTLSRGLQQRVSLARAFLHSPRLLLLDEPFTGLDAASSRNLEGILRHLPHEGRAVVFSTHSFEQGASIARRLVALEAGQMRYDGPLSLAPLQALGIH